MFRSSRIRHGAGNFSRPFSPRRRSRASSEPDLQRELAAVVAQPKQNRRLFHHRPGNADWESAAQIGEGGMGVVYEAIDRKRNLRIAIKSAKPGFQRLLSPELEGALRVRHPNICLVNQIHSTKTDKGDVDF